MNLQIKNKQNKQDQLLLDQLFNKWKSLSQEEIIKFKQISETNETMSKELGLTDTNFHSEQTNTKITFNR